MIDGEKNIIERAILGEASAFGLLYEHYEPQIYRFIYLKVGHREEAEDLTHQVFLQSWQKITDYSYEGFPFGSWLYRIARNEIIDHYRTKKYHLDLENEGVINSLERKADNPLPKKLDQDINLLRLKNAIRQLKPAEQDVIVLRFIEDFPPGEVAKIIEKTPIAVRIIQHRAIKNLKKILHGTA